MYVIKLFTFLICISSQHALAACPYANELKEIFGSEQQQQQKMPPSHQRYLRNKLKHNEASPEASQQSHLGFQRTLQEGLINEGKGCWGRCNRIAGDCDYCGTGQCCRLRDYETGVDGCELAFEVTGPVCGAFRGVPEERLRNEGKACMGHCDRKPGNCDYCGTGQCCRRVDNVNGVPGCELATESMVDWDNGPASQCGAFNGLLNENKGCWGFCDSTA